MHQPAQLQMDECECSLHVVFFFAESQSISFHIAKRDFISQINRLLNGLWWMRRISAEI